MSEKYSIPIRIVYLAIKSVCILLSIFLLGQTIILYSGF